MSWLAPWYLLGAVAIAGPILFHLWRKTPRGRQPFSTLMFLRSSPPRMTSRSRMEHWWLMALRGLVLLLLAFAFMRPFWRSETFELPTAEPPPRIAILVDTSASLQRQGVWNDLQHQITTKLADAPPKAVWGLFSFETNWKEAVGFEQTRQLTGDAGKALLVQNLQALKPGWGGTRLGQAVARTVSALQDEALRDSVARSSELWLATDLVEGANLSGLETIEWPSGLKVVLIRATPNPAGNAGLQLVAHRLESPQDPLRVRVTNSSDSTVEEFSLAPKDVSDAKPVSVLVPRGEARVVAIPRETADLATTFTLTGDGVPFDNEVWTVPTGRPRYTVAYLGKDTPQDPQGLRFYLEGALAASDRYDLRVVEEHPPAGEAQPTLTVISDSTQVPLDFRAELAKGHTALAVLTDAADSQKLLSLCGMDGATVEEAGNSEMRLQELDFQSPWLSPFAEARFGDFTGIRFWKHRKVTFPASAQPQILAKFEDGSPAWCVLPIGKGQLHVMTSGWQPADSQFARSSKFAPLMIRLLEESAGIAPQSIQRLVGEPLWTNASDRPTALVLPNQTRLTESSQIADAAIAQQPGIYTLLQEDEETQIAVNLPPDESRTTPLDLEQLVANGVPMGTAQRTASLARAAEQRQQLHREELEQQQKLWWWLLVALAVILLLESALATWRTRQTAALAAQ